jgi:tetratricopeptide (TPR) repeat protein
LAYLAEDLLRRRAARKVGAICCISLGLIFSSLGVQRTLTWGSAETLWAAELKDAPHMPRPHLYMGNVHREAGQNQRALNSYARALVVHPEVLSGGDLVSIYNNMGATYLAMERFDEAVAAYEKTLGIDPEYEQARASLEAIAALRQEAGQKEAKDWQRRGLVALIRGDLSQAVILLNESLAKQPLLGTYMALAQAYERLDNTRAALAVYRALLDSNPAGPSADQVRLRIEELSRRATAGGGKP